MNKKLIFGIAIILLIIIGFGLSSYFLCYNKGNGFFCNPFSNSKPGAVSGIKIVKVESFTDKIQLQLQDDQSYKIYWPDVSNKGNGDPTKFFYQYFVWEGPNTNPTLTSSSPSPAQTGKTPTPSFILDQSLNSSSQITVIITANNEFGASSDALKSFFLQQSPSIKSAEFNTASIVNGLLVNNPIVDIEMGSFGGEPKTSTTINSYIDVNSTSGTLINKVLSDKCFFIPNTNKKAQCFFTMTGEDLYGGNNFTINANAQNTIGRSSNFASNPFQQKKISPSGVIPGQIQLDNSSTPINSSLQFRIKHTSSKGDLYLMYYPSNSSFMTTPNQSQASIFEVDVSGKYKETTTGLYLNANKTGGTIQLKAFIPSDVKFYQWIVDNTGNMYLSGFGKSYGNVQLLPSGLAFGFTQTADPNFSLEPYSPSKKYKISYNGNYINHSGLNLRLPSNPAQGDVFIIGEDGSINLENTNLYIQCYDNNGIKIKLDAGKNNQYMFDISSFSKAGNFINLSYKNFCVYPLSILVMNNKGCDQINKWALTLVNE